MISEEKVKIMTEMARYEKKYGERDFQINRYREEDYIRLETIKMSIALTVAFLIILTILCLSQLDVLIVMLRKGKFLFALLSILIIYVIVFLVYLHFTKKRAIKDYKEVEARIKIYDKYLEELLRLYEEKEHEDVSPSIDPEEQDDGTTINI